MQLNAAAGTFLIGIGGSATNDGGIGMLQALGFGMLDENGNQVEFGAKDFASLNQSQLAMCCQSFQNVHSVLPAMSQIHFAALLAAVLFLDRKRELTLK